DQHVEAQAPAGAELQDPDPAFAAVVEHHSPHSARCGQVAGDPFEGQAPGPRLPAGRACGRHDITYSIVDFDRLAAAYSSLTRRTTRAGGRRASSPPRRTPRAGA